MNITIPELCLVLLIGASGSGKSTFARKHFLPTEVISSDWCRALVSDDENNQSATAEAFDLLHYIIGKRLKGGRIAVVDATNVRAEDRKELIRIAYQYHCLPVGIVFDLPERVCRDRNSQRKDRSFGPHVIRGQMSNLHRSMRLLAKEFKYVHFLNSEDEANKVTITRQPLWNNKKLETGPFDIIGDVHGCYDELLELLDTLGYQVSEAGDVPTIQHPAGRRLIFLGDLVDRGPGTPQVLKLVMSAVASGTGFCVAGNHDVKLARALRGKKVQLTHGLADSMAQLEGCDESFRTALLKFIDGLVSHYVFDGGQLVVAHAGLREEMQGRAAGQVRAFAMFGETTGENDEYGLPIRYNWANDYRGKALVVYGHTPTLNAEWLNNTICIDTGCAFGGKLTALRYPERHLVDLPARQMYYEPVRPLSPAGSETGAFSLQQQSDDLLDIADFIGKRIITPGMGYPVSIRAENAAAALEVMTRFAVNPKWLAYLPPTMSPSETSHEPGFLEHPREALEYYRNAGVNTVVCEEKHMGSRAVVIVCRDDAAVLRRFGISNEGRGTIYTRTGRRFFSDTAMELLVLERLSAAISDAGLWEEFSTDWFIFDCELMPWSYKAQELIRKQYASVGAASRTMLGAAEQLIARSSSAGEEMADLIATYSGRIDDARRFSDAYRHYCWNVVSIDDIRLAPFHILASEGHIHLDRNHVWHMETLHRLSAADPRLLVATNYLVVELDSREASATAEEWWLGLTLAGGEGMVVKPLDFIPRGSSSNIQPAVKCRGREYLRIIYGPEYSREEHLIRLRKRGLTNKRSMALREFYLGVESLERFIRREPLRRVHECVFGVLAMESEPVDPRL